MSHVLSPFSIGNDPCPARQTYGARARHKWREESRKRRRQAEETKEGREGGNPEEEAKVVLRSALPTGIETQRVLREVLIE